MKKQPRTLTLAFKRIFGLNLFDYWDVMTGFDLLKFDTWLQTPDDLSVLDVLSGRYGEAGVETVSRLIEASA